MKPSAQEVRLYKEWLHRARIKESKTAIPNELPWHSRCAVSELTAFAIDKQQEAQKAESPSVTVRLFTGTVAPYVYDHEWVAKIKQFLAFDGHLNVLLWNDEISDETAELLAPILAYENANARFSRTRKAGNKLNHFFVVDEQAFRKEAPHDYCPAKGFTETSPEIPAQICFNDPDEAAELVKFFDAIWDACDPVPELLEVC